VGGKHRKKAHFKEGGAGGICEQLGKGGGSDNVWTRSADEGGGDLTCRGSIVRKEEGEAFETRALPRTEKGGRGKRKESQRGEGKKKSQSLRV